MSVITVGRCNAIKTSGCRVPAPSVPNSEFQASIDPVTDTIYASNLNLPEIDVLDGATCHAGHLSGCAPLAEIPMISPDASMGAIDDSDHTLYASDGSGIVVVIDTAACNATHTTGCGTAASTITIGPHPGSPVLNLTTQTLYLSFGTDRNEIAVVNAATCSAEVASGCEQTPGVVAVGEGTSEVAVSSKTDTIYAPSVGIPFAAGNTVAVINGATCNGNDHSGCAHLAATVTVGVGPYGVAVDDATNTVYVANNTNGDTPGTVSVIDGATCNGFETAGCTGPFSTVVVGRSPLLLAIDTATDTVYVTDYSSAGVSVLNGATCNAEVASRCRVPAPEQAVGSQPYGLAVDQATNSIYAMNQLGLGSTSVFRGRS